MKSAFDSNRPIDGPRFDKTKHNSFPHEAELKDREDHKPDDPGSIIAF
jgi:hypothetical protein